MKDSELRSVIKFSSKKNPLKVELSEGSYMIATFIGFPKKFYLFTEQQEVELSRGIWRISVNRIKEPQVFNKVLSMGNYSCLCSIEYSYIRASLNAAKIYKNYSESDLGFIKELEESIDSLTEKIAKLDPENNSANIELFKKLVDKVILKVASSYSIEGVRINYHEFSKG